MRKEHLRCVLWPHGHREGPNGKVYRYAIVGMLVSDKPIREFNGKNELVLDGSAPGMAEVLVNLKRKTPLYRLGDASSVLCSLDTIVKEVG